MPKYAPGTDAYDEGRERRFRREATRRQNISDLLIGGGQIMQALGAARRAREERAANDLYAQRIEQLMSGGASGPAPSSVKPPNAPWAGQSIGGGEDMVSIPQPREQSFNEQLAQDAGAGRGGFLENLKNSFTFGTGAPRLKPEHMMALWQAHEGMRQRATENQRYTDERVYRLGRDTIEDRQKKDAARAELKKWQAEQNRLIGEFESKAEQDAEEERGRDRRAKLASDAKIAAANAEKRFTPDQEQDNWFQMGESIRRAKAKAAWYRQLKNVTMDQATIQAMVNSNDEEQKMEGSFLASIYNSVTTPEQRHQKLEEAALERDAVANELLNDPVYVKSQKNRSALASLIGSDEPVVEPASDEEVEAWLAKKGIDPLEATPDIVETAEREIAAEKAAGPGGGGAKSGGSWTDRIAEFFGGNRGN